MEKPASPDLQVFSISSEKPTRKKQAQGTSQRQHKIRTLARGKFRPAGMNGAEPMFQKWADNGRAGCSVRLCLTGA